MPSDTAIAAIEEPEWVTIEQSEYLPSMVGLKQRTEERRILCLSTAAVNLVVFPDHMGPVKMTNSFVILFFLRAAIVILNSGGRVVYPVSDLDETGFFESFESIRALRLDDEGITRLQDARPERVLLDVLKCL